AVLHHGAGRHHRHRDTARRRIGYEATAEVPEGRRRGAARHYRARRAAAIDRAAQVGPMDYCRKLIATGVFYAQSGQRPVRVPATMRRTAPEADAGAHALAALRPKE